MTRKEFLKFTTLLLSSPLFASNKTKKKMPALFISHGSPMNIILDNSYTKKLKNISKTFEKPKAIIVISAHWYENQTLVSNAEEQETIYDFYNFPDILYDIVYEPKGNPTLANSISNKIKAPTVDRGLDHGAWSILRHMYPKADIPTFQISINNTLTYKQHFKLGKILSILRENGVLIIGSGSVTHNLRLTNPNAQEIDTWALSFDEYVKDAFNFKKSSKLINIKEHPLFTIAHPYDDHYIPLLYSAACINSDDKVEHFHDEIISGNLTMRCIKIG
ncbi:4,5-DOPA dioxygenase extradiol [Arcobacter sp. F155]|uniref:4,5-DOPA-extradiol-dioxygenase n=1 Tax=Arcobacter sp. F155 TaxID=2044512 RepID=UPI00100BCDE1|nr:4,5-DOPA dioxygenase extradiol [Arcobacter sp. F155]RXJ77960.1 4,5-DOPA dioxygenase extradiol [Arcobacter sp. F155]